MNKNSRNVLIIGLSVIILIVVGVGGFLFGRFGFGFKQNYQFMPMMGRFNRGFVRWQYQQPSSEIISLEDAENAVEEYIKNYPGYKDLRISEIMIFDNHAYAQVIEEDTGIGAFEVLIDPNTYDVNLEQGASMMWNSKYGHMRRSMMGGVFPQNGEDMFLSEEDAIATANKYLANIGSNLSADDHADQFYGYYTLHTLEDGEVVGMLSVNGYSGQIIIHNWHGDLIAMSDHGNDNHENS